jgi:hypothetical protein
MLPNDSYLFYAGWLFFLAWIVMVVIAVVAAFGWELIPAPARAEDPLLSHSHDFAARH